MKTLKRVYISGDFGSKKFNADFSNPLDMGKEVSSWAWNEYACESRRIAVALALEYYNNYTKVNEESVIDTIIFEGKEALTSFNSKINIIIQDLLNNFIIVEEPEESSVKEPVPDKSIQDKDTQDAIEQPVSNIDSTTRGAIKKYITDSGYNYNNRRRTQSRFVGPNKKVRPDWDYLKEVIEETGFDLHSFVSNLRDRLGSKISKTAPYTWYPLAMAYHYKVVPEHSVFNNNVDRILEMFEMNSSRKAIASKFGVTIKVVNIWTKAINSMIDENQMSGNPKANFPKDGIETADILKKHPSKRGFIKHVTITYGISHSTASNWFLRANAIGRHLLPRRDIFPGIHTVITAANEGRPATILAKRYNINPKTASIWIEYSELRMKGKICKP